MKNILKSTVLAFALMGTTVSAGGYQADEAQWWYGLVAQVDAVVQVCQFQTTTDWAGLLEAFSEVANAANDEALAILDEIYEDVYYNAISELNAENCVAQARALEAGDPNTSYDDRNIFQKG